MHVLLMERLELSNTKLHSKVYRRETSIMPGRSRQFGLGSTTAAEMVRLLSLLHRDTILDGDDRKEVLNHLLACEDRTKLARELGPEVRMAHKTGAVASCRADAGIIYSSTGPVAVCVLTSENEDQRWIHDNAANVLCGKIGRAVIERFGDASSTPTAPNLSEGSYGLVVESLQRTLNRRLSPSPDLAIDGDFGPATRSAAERFQRENDINADGIVKFETWKKLGPLIAQDDPVPTPEEVRATVLPISPQTPLDGPPVVTCRAWVIGDLSGQVLWASDQNQALEVASTTKIMTAHVVMNLARESPSLLDEVVTFTQRADSTIGSTSGLRAGEKTTVRELLYGLYYQGGWCLPGRVRRANESSLRDCRTGQQFLARSVQRCEEPVSMGLAANLGNQWERVTVHLPKNSPSIRRLRRIQLKSFHEASNKDEFRSKCWLSCRKHHETGSRFAPLLRGLQLGCRPLVLRTADPLGL